ncbi:MAG TPA: YihY/virulence factor BrkB family protein [Allosphingosinicella sp.]|nr:YihY/virulence factor BrkB family protein [Allosphingosinicella sp.]
MRRDFGIAVAAPSPLSASRPIDGPEDIPPQGWKDIALATWKDAGEDNLTLISAGVAFYAFLAFVPLLTAFVLSYGLIAEPSSVVSHMHTLTSVMPQNAAGIIGDQLQSMTETSGAKTGFALLLAVGIALYGASKGAGAVMTALNIVFEVGETRSFVRRTLLALAMTAGAVIVLFLAILAISALNFLENLMPDVGGVTQVLLKALFFVAAAGAVVLLLAVIYRYGPNRPEAEWKWITPGSGVATLVWLAATFGFGLYVANFGNYNATYGSLGAVIVFLTWLYLTAYIVLMGAELNAIIEAEVGQEKVQDDSAARSAAEPKDIPAIPEETPAPSFGKVVARIGLFSMLLKLLGRSRRPRAGR